MYTDYYSVIGTGHELNRTPCQDVGSVFKAKDLTVVAVSDGCSAFPNTDTVAELTIRGLSEFVHQHENTIVKGRFSPDRFMKGLLIKISNLYKEHCGKYPYYYMASTLAFIIINHTNDEYYLFSVGDSTVLSVDCFGKVSVRMAPYHKDITSTVFCCNIKESISTYQFSKGDIYEDGREAFLIMTDGGASAPHHSYTDLILSLAKHDDFERRVILKDFCKNIRLITDDDITVALIMPGDAPPPLGDNENRCNNENERNPFNELLNALLKPVTVQELCDQGIYPEGQLLSALIPLVSSGMAIKVDDKGKTKYCLSDEMMEHWPPTNDKEE